MKYCINYNQFTEKAKCIKNAEEWTIEYNPKDRTLIEFLDLYKDKRINLYIKEKLERKFLEELCIKYPNLYIKLNYELFNIIFEDKTEIKARYFFDNLINNFDTLNGIISLGVSDIYVVEELCFQIDKVAAIAHKKNIAIRVFPNIAQSQWKETPALKKFFIRPEDIDIYEKFIDTIEFYNVDKKINIYYEIYKNKKWAGKLKEIILDFNSDIDNRFLAPGFASKRIKCNKKCFINGKCNWCDTLEHLSKTLEEKNLIIRKGVK